MNPEDQGNRFRLLARGSYAEQVNTHRPTAPSTNTHSTRHHPPSPRPRDPTSSS
ncbi:hypothetical protein [Frankia gtarii]|uniref:hypothetical protein n=1 Tax=Frankia gtarii TaxID=2950102 RepID=UPI0021BF11F0|nr:hypothetical protein [Frankia gtarii]